MKRSFRTKAMTFFLFTALTLYSGLDRNNSFGWLAQNVSVPENTNGGAIGSYFGGGDGTEATPYLIKTPRHLYNLAWLQDIGIFNQKTETDADGNKRIKPTYFKIDSTEIDMTNLALPPIGTTKYPFISHLEGNNGVIKNLHVTDDFSQLTHHPYTIDAHKDTYVDSSTNILKNCEIIGAFGVIGLYNYNKEITLPDGKDFSTYTVSSSAISVSDVYYDNLTIEPKASKTLAGLLAGYVAGTLTTSGVYHGSIQFQSSQTSLTNIPLSKYTLVGDYNSSVVSWLDRPGSQKGWGNTIDIESLFTRADLIYKAGGSTTKFYSQFYGMSGIDATAGSSYQFKGKGTFYFPLRVSNALTNSYYTSSMTGGETIDTANNSGYLGGNTSSGQVKFQFNKDAIGTVLTTNGENKTSGTGVTWSNGKVTDINFWTKRNSDSNTTNVEKSEEVYNPLFGTDSRVSTVKKQVISMLNDQITSVTSPKDSDLSVYSLKFTGNKADQNQSICIPKAYLFGQEIDNFYMPARTLSFTAYSDGYICLVGFNADEDWGSLLNIYKHGSILTNNVLSLTKVESATNSAGTTVFSSAWNQIPRGKLMFYQIPITKGDHYAVSAADNNNGIRLLYLDLGLNGNQSAEKTNKVKDIDFVYTKSDGTIVKIGASGTADSTYVFSDVLFQLEVASSATLHQVVLYIKRTKTDAADAVHYYYDKTSNLSLSVIGTDNNATAETDKTFYTA